MLKDRLYSIDRIEHNDGIMDCLIHFNPSDPIFGGHFPGQPVVPGVCLVQIIREMMEMAVENPVLLREASQIKFLKPIDPGQNPEANVRIILEKGTENKYSSNAVIQFRDDVFMKFKGTFELEQD